MYSLLTSPDPLLSEWLSCRAPTVITSTTAAPSHCHHVSPAHPSCPNRHNSATVTPTPSLPHTGSHTDPNTATQFQLNSQILFSCSLSTFVSEDYLNLYHVLRSSLKYNLNPNLFLCCRRFIYSCIGLIICELFVLETVSYTSSPDVEYNAKLGLVLMSHAFSVFASAKTRCS